MIDRWISVKESLPKPGVLVDTFIENKDVLQIDSIRSNFIEEDNFWAYYPCITSHWRPKRLIELSEKRRNELLEDEFFYKQGKQAYLKDIYLNMNPYDKEHPEHVDWENGWFDAKLELPFGLNLL